MIFNDYYEIELIVNSETIKLSPTDYSFILYDSIHSLYNWATFNIKDLTGLIQESLFTVKGLKITLGYGIRDNKINKSEFTIDHDKITEPSQKGILSGDVEINLINSWYDKQELKSSAYNDSISNIIRQIVTQKFSSFNIESTGNDDTWYQPLITDAKFIQDVLLPNSYSDNSNKSPFYAFINSDGTFNFRNLNSMLKDNPAANLKYIAEAQEGDFSINNIMRLRRWRIGNEKLRNLIHRGIYKIDISNGSLIEEEDFIFSHPEGTTGNVPIIGDRNLFTGLLNLGYSKTDIGQKQSLLGRQINSIKDSMFIDKMLIIVPLNPKLIAGKIVNIFIFTLDNINGNIQKSSTTFSGNYLIEESRHTWNGERREGFTTLIVGRKFIDLNSSYFIKSLFIQ